LALGVGVALRRRSALVGESSESFDLVGVLRRLTTPLPLPLAALLLLSTGVGDGNSIVVDAWWWRADVAADVSGRWREAVRREGAADADAAADAVCVDMSNCCWGGWWAW